MKIDWRVSAVAGGAAFGLSLLVGVFGGVAFVALILRASLAALVFAAGSVGVGLIIDRFLPELRQAPGAQPGVAESAGVDIVVEGDDDIAELSAGFGESGAVRDAVDADGGEPITDPAVPDGAVEDAEVVEEVESVEDESVAEEGDAAGELPNVDAMTDSFTEVPLAEEAVAEPLDSGEDPALMARAIRSVLKREE